MRLSSLCVAAVLLLSVATFAQHSSGGGGGGSSSSASSGGGGGSSHGGSSGGSSYSGGGHSSGGSGSSSSAHSSGGSSSHVSSGHGSSSAPTSSHSGSIVHSNTAKNTERSVHEPNSIAHGKTEISQKRSFFSFLRHPFRKPAPNPEPKTKPVADLRRPVCLRGPCTFCPPGQAHAGGCGGAFYIRHERRYCTSGEIWNGGECLLQTQFLDSCNGLRMAMQRQEQRMRDAESARQSTCASGSSQSCLDSTSAAQSEAGLYRTFQARYQRCMQQSLAGYTFTGFGFGFGHGFGFGGYSSGLLFEPLELQFNYP